MSRASLAEICRVTPAAVSTWVRGQAPRPTRLVEIANALQMSVDFLTTRAGALPVNVEGLRAAYMTQLTVYGWPAPFDGGREYGNPAEHAFELNLRIRVREMGQDSGDIANALSKAANLAACTLLIDATAPDESLDADARLAWMREAVDPVAIIASTPTGPGDPRVAPASVETMTQQSTKLLEFLELRPSRRSSAGLVEAVSVPGTASGDA
jgi:transcriptional regulator with XRE-family HTH domain